MQPSSTIELVCRISVFNLPQTPFNNFNLKFAAKLNEIKMNSGKDVPLKVMINTVTCFEKTESGWNYKIDNSNFFSLSVKSIHIQGEICKTAGFSNEIMIIDDGSSKAKVTRGDSVPGNFDWVKTGEQCSVVGILVSNGKLPHVAAIKIAKIHNKILQEMWSLEVQELKNFLSNKIIPKLPEVQ